MQQRLRTLTERTQRVLITISRPSRYQRLWASIKDAASFLHLHISLHQSVVALTIFILINNSLVAQAASSVPSLPTDTVVSDPYQIADTVRLLSEWTPDIDEDAEAIAQSLESRVTGEFLSTNPLIATEPSQTDEPTTVSPSPPTAVAERKKDVKYTVAIGDTLSGIGSKFDLKLSTIKITNNISDVDSLKPGQELTIPVNDLSDKAIKAAEDRKKASTQLAQNKASKAKVSTAKASGGYGLIVPIRHNGISRGLIPGVHTGVDYRANIGTPVMAAADGVVIVATETGWNGGYGKTILISHGGDKTTRYGHLSDVQVQVGEHVSQGEQIALSGNTGRSTGPHLHFELRIDGRALNPF